jgi:hypothetical protein
MKNDKSNVIIRFAMTKGEGHYPSRVEFTPEEIADIRQSCHFYLVFNAEESESDLSDLVIEECVVIYDGITYSKEKDCGLYFEEGQLCGWPIPIIQFKLSRHVDAEDFKTCVWTSGFVVSPFSRDEKDEAPFVFEDHNGYTSVLDGTEIQEIVNALKKNKLYSGKIFTKDEMENGDYCMEMA